MALQFPPGFVQASGPTNTAALLRQIFSTLTGEGVCTLNDADDMKVSQDTGSDMKVSIAVGAAWVTGDADPPAQGRYFAFNDAAELRDVPASDLTNPRIDLVVLQMDDTFYGAGSDGADFVVIAGTPDPTPVRPATPTSALPLAAIAVGAGVSAIHNADITDLRPAAGSGGGAVIGCRVSRTTVQSVANNAAENASFDATDDWDSDGYHDSTGVTINRTIIKIPTGRAGIHRLFASGQFASDPDGRRRMTVILNGVATKARCSSPAVNGAVTALQVFDELDLADGDEIQFELFHTAGAALDVLSLFAVVERVGSKPGT